VTSSTKREWLVPTGLIMLSLVPVAAGGARVAELASGAQVTPDNARFFANWLSCQGFVDEGEGVRAARATVGPGAERQVVGQANPHHLAGFDHEVPDGRRDQRLSPGRRDGRVLAQHLVDGAVPGPFDQNSRGLARLDEQPDAGRGRLVEDTTENCHQPVDGHVGAGSVAGTRLVGLCDVAHQVDDGIIGADRATQDRHRVRPAAGPK